jgi:hypothetical protein
VGEDGSGVSGGAIVRAVARSAYRGGLDRRTALSDLLQLNDAQVTKDRLYRALDQLLAHKEALEGHLSRRCGELFAVQNEVLL